MGRLNLHSTEELNGEKLTSKHLFRTSQVKLEKARIKFIKNQHEHENAA